MANRENEVSWIYSGWWLCENRVTRKTSVLQYIGSNLNVENSSLLPLLKLWVSLFTNLKAGPLRLQQQTNTLKVRISSQTNTLYLISYAAIILIVGLHLKKKRMLTSEHCLKKNIGVQRARTSYFLIIVQTFYQLTCAAETMYRI